MCGARVTNVTLNCNKYQPNGLGMDKVCTSTAWWGHKLSKQLPHISAQPQIIPEGQFPVCLKHVFYIIKKLRHQKSLATSETVRVLLSVSSFFITAMHRSHWCIQLFQRIPVDCPSILPTDLCTAALTELLGVSLPFPWTQLLRVLQHLALCTPD